MSDTPKTDELLNKTAELYPDAEHNTLVEFARRLERENAALRKAFNEAGILFFNQREDGHREWWCDGTWVRRGEFVVLIDKAAIDARKEQP